MRKNLVKAAFLFSWAILIGCQSKDPFPSNQAKDHTSATIHDQPREIQLAYAQLHLTTLATGIASLADNPLFRDLLYKEVAKERDGETSVTFSHLFHEAQKLNVNLLTAMLPVVDEQSLIKAKDAFTGIDGKIYYPQIFIPYYAERTSSPNHRIAASTPVIIIFTGKSSKDNKYPGYRRNAQGKLVPTGFMVDEEYAKQNEVWVISLNETKVATIGGTNQPPKCTESLGSFQGGGLNCLPGEPVNPPGPGTPPPQPVPIPRYCTPDGNPGNPHATQGGIDVYVYRMAVGCHKESWVSGKSEVYVKMTATWNTGWNFAKQYVPKAYWYTVPKEDKNTGAKFPYSAGSEEIKLGGDKWPRSFIENYTVLDVNTIIAAQWGGWQIQPWKLLNLPAERDRRGDIICYLIFELDGWPAPRPTTTLYTPGGLDPNKQYTSNSVVVEYPSEDSPYAVGNFDFYQGSPNYACGEKLDNGCIKFEMVTRGPFNP